MPLQNYAANMGQMADLVSAPVNTLLASRDQAAQEARRNALAASEVQKNQAYAQNIQADQQAQVEAQHQQQARAILAAGRAGNPAARKYAFGLLVSKMPPEMQSQMQQQDPEQAWPHVEAALASYLGEKPQEQPQQPGPLAMQDLGGGVRVVTQGGKAVGSPHWPEAQRAAAMGGGAMMDPNATPTKAPPPGYRWKQQPDGSWGQEAIPGGPADTKTKTQDLRLAGIQAKAMGQLSAVKDQLQRLYVGATKLKASPGLPRILGIQGKVPNWPGGDAANAQAALETLKGQIGINALQQMRSLSPTGGALGQVSNFENQMLQNSLTALQQSQSYDEFLKRLDDVINFASGSQQRLQEAYDNQFGGQAAPQDAQSAHPEDIQNILKKYPKK